MIWHLNLNFEFEKACFHQNPKVIYRTNRLHD